MLSEKEAVKDYQSEENNCLSFSKGQQIQINKENQEWGRVDGVLGKQGTYFPLKYVAA